MKLKKLAAILSISIATGVTISGCSEQSGLGSSTDASMALKAKVLQTNADIAYAVYSDSVATMQAFQQVLQVFEKDRSMENLTALKQAWLVAREPYGQSEVFRFRLSPIDSTNYRDEDGPEGDINAWPLGEALIDYVSMGEDFADDQVGVSAHQTPVNSGQPVLGKQIQANNTLMASNIVLDEALLSNTATAEDERDVIAGYHALEFMLWGQDLNQTAPLADGPRDPTAGQRPLSDFLSDRYAERRLQYMQVVTNKLLKDLTGVRDAWATPEQPGYQTGNYRDQFTAVEDSTLMNKRLTEILSAMGTLGASELAGERMQIALTTNSQEDEHSCFSDNTHRDIVTNALGIQNTYYGDYAGYDSDGDGVADQTQHAVKGYGFDDLMRDSQQMDAASKFESLLAITEAGYQKIDTLARNGLPFDNQIQQGARHADAKAVRDTIVALNQQSLAIKRIVGPAVGAADFNPLDDTACNTSDPTASCE